MPHAASVLSLAQKWKLNIAKPDNADINVLLFNLIKLLDREATT
jgi:hypothetical protein